jgi:hypothetical protein
MDCSWIARHIADSSLYRDDVNGLLFKREFGLIKIYFELELDPANLSTIHEMDHAHDMHADSEATA